VKTKEECWDEFWEVMAVISMERYRTPEPVTSAA